MTTPDPLDVLRAELRRLYVAASPGPWSAPRLAAGPAILVSGDDATRRRVASFERESDAALAAAARNALPTLFRALDDARAARAVPVPVPVPVLGTVGPGGAVAWRGTPPRAVAAAK